MRRGEVTPPYGCNTGGAQQRADVPKAWLPPTKFRAEIWGVSHGHRPLRKEEQATSTTRVSGAQRSVCGADGRSGRGSRQRSSPKGSATPDNPSVMAFGHASSLYTREPLGTGDTDCRVASLLAMTVLILCHSEEAQRANVGILPFYDGRWTGVRAAVPRAWPPPTKFRAEIWGVGQVVGPYGKPNQPPKPAGAQRSVRARGREGWAGIDERTIPKEGPPPRLPRQRLAKRKARKEQLVKFGLCPMTSEGSTAYRVRKFAKGPARALAGAVSIE